MFPRQSIHKTNCAAVYFCLVQQDACHKQNWAVATVTIPYTKCIRSYFHSALSPVLQLHTVCFECYGSVHNIRKPYQYCNNFLQHLKPPLYRIKHCTSSCGHNNIWFVPFTLAVVLRTLQTTTIHTTVLHSFILFLLQGVVNNVSSYLKTSLGHWYCGLVLLSCKAGCA